MFVYKMFRQVGDIQNNRKHLFDKFLVLLHLWSVYNGNDTQTMATTTRRQIAYYPIWPASPIVTPVFPLNIPLVSCPSCITKYPPPAPFNSTLLSPPCIVGSTRLSFHSFVGPGRGIILWKRYLGCTAFLNTAKCLSRATPKKRMCRCMYVKKICIYTCIGITICRCRFIKWLFQYIPCFILHWSILCRSFLGMPRCLKGVARPKSINFRRFFSILSSRNGFWREQVGLHQERKQQH